MMDASDRAATRDDQVRELRHDLLNHLNVLVGAADGLLRSPLTDEQRAWVRMLQSATARLTKLAEQLDEVQAGVPPEGQALLADLCSIAVARVGKPFDRTRLVRTIERVAGQRPLRVLVVDDSPELEQLVRSYLRDTGWELDVVQTGEEAVAQATTAPYDVVLMDIGLPGLDGATAAHAIRAADLARGASPTPIIAMTALDRGTDTDTRPREDEDDGEAPVAADPEIAALVPEFLTNRRAEVAAMRDALAAADFSRIQSAAHKLKGSGRGYGFPRLSRLGGELELAAHHQDVGRMTDLIDELDAYLARLPHGARPTGADREAP